MKKFAPLFAIIILACSSIDKSIKEAKYSAYEMIGYEKRDLFKSEIENVKEGQEESQEAFEDSLEQLKHFYSFDGGKLEKEYNKLKNSYQQSYEHSQDLKESIAKLDNVAQDLFSEWKTEISEMNSRNLRSKSNEKLNTTKTKYKDFYQKLKSSEKKMDPLLAKLKDQVTFLKHNLNANAITGLKDESQKIEGEIELLIEDMKKSNKEAEEFIKILE